MSVLTRHVDALRARRARYAQSLINLDHKLSAHPGDALVEAYVEQEKAKLTVAIVSIDDDLVLLK